MDFSTDIYYRIGFYHWYILLGWILPLIYIIWLDFTTDMYRYSNNLNLGCWVGLFNWYALRRGWLSTESDQTDLLMVGSTICWVTSSINTRSCRRKGSWKWNKTINTDPRLLSSVGESKYALWKRRIYLMIYSCHSIVVGWYRRQEFRTSKWEAVLKFFNISAKNKISFKQLDLWLKRAISAEIWSDKSDILFYILWHPLFHTAMHPLTPTLSYCHASFDTHSFILPCIFDIQPFMLPCILWLFWLFHDAMRQWTPTLFASWASCPGTSLSAENGRSRQSSWGGEPDKWPVGCTSCHSF